MSRLITIYKTKGTTFIKVVENGETTVHSSNSTRDLDTTQFGVKILPNGDLNSSLNNFEIKLNELTNTLGASTPEELLEAIADNEFFSSGGTGSGGTTIVEANFKAKLVSTVNEGGIKVGDTFNIGDPIEDFAHKLAGKYIAPSFSSFSLNASETSPISGEEVTFSTANLSFQKDSENNNPKNVTISGVNFGITLPDGQTSSTVAEFGVTKTGGQSQTWGLSGQDKDNVSIPGRTYSVVWYNQFLFGASPLELDNSNFQAILDSLSVASLNSKTTTKTANTDNNNTSNYTYAAFATEYGNLNNVIQDGASPVLGAFTLIGSFDWVNSFGVTIATNVYRTNAKGAFAPGTNLSIS